MLKNENEFTEKHIAVTRIYRELQKAQDYKIIVNEGGARSSKSYSCCQFFLFEKLLKVKDFKLLVLRKVRHDLKLSSYEMFIDILKEYGIYDEGSHNKSDLIYSFPNNCQIRFSGMDDLRQVKSTGWSSIWLEEANEFENKDLTFLKTRLSTGTDIKIYLTYNPEECWIQDLEKDPTVKFIFSNYKDNPTLTKDYTDMLESIKDEDEDYYKVFTLGERAKRGNLVYSHFKFIDIKEWQLIKFDNTIYGIDWGFNSPCSLIEINIKDSWYYIQELIYQTHLTTPDFISLIKEKIPKDRIETADIYCDSEDPGNIQECYNAGLYGAKPSNKEVLPGIETVKRNKIFVLNTSINIMNEYKKYKWKKDKNGNYIDEPVKLFDHCMDPIRYAIHTFNPANDLRIR